jgi:F-type H+-transporting ATPase subunit delta
MKITARQYALSLSEAVDNKSAREVEAIIKKFIELLAGRNQLGEAEKIIAEFVKIWNDQRGVVEAEVASADGLAKEIVKLLKNYIAELSGAKEVLISEKIDKNILGGVVIKYGDKVLDGSLKMALADLREKLIK